mgnify:CR=1 FL=1
MSFSLSTRLLTDTPQVTGSPAYPVAPALLEARRPTRGQVAGDGEHVLAVDVRERERVRVARGPEDRQRDFAALAVVLGPVDVEEVRVVRVLPVLEHVPPPPVAPRHLHTEVVGHDIHHQPQPGVVRHPGELGAAQAYVTGELDVPGALGPRRWGASGRLVVEVVDSVLDVAGESALFFVGVVVVALLGGVAPAALSALLSGLLLNYFLVTPRYTFTIAEPDSAVTVVVLLLVAVAVAVLARAVKDP